MDAARGGVPVVFFTYLTHGLLRGFD